MKYIILIFGLSLLTVYAEGNAVVKAKKQEVETITSKVVQELVDKGIAKQIESKALEDQAKRKFAGLDFGVGISLTLDGGDNSRVQSAVITDGIVRVEKENNAIARIMLESHYFFTPGKTKTFGWGPFIALQPGTEEIIEAIGAGVMFGWRKEGSEKGSWNIGIGAIVDPNVKILGDGFVENQAPPGAETQIRFKETSQAGLMFIASFSF